MALPAVPDHLTAQYKNAYFLYARNVPGNLDHQEIIRYFRRQCFQVHFLPETQNTTQSPSNRGSKRSTRATARVWLMCSTKELALDIRRNFGYQKWGGRLLEISGPFPLRHEPTVLSLGFNPLRRDPAYVFRLQLVNIARVRHLDVVLSENDSMSVIYLYYDGPQNADNDFHRIQGKCSHRKDFVLSKGQQSRSYMQSLFETSRNSSPSNQDQSASNQEKYGTSSNASRSPVTHSRSHANTGDIVGPSPARSSKFSPGHQTNGKHPMEPTEPSPGRRSNYGAAHSQGPSKRSRSTSPANQNQAKVKRVADRWRPSYGPSHPPEPVQDENKGTLIGVPTNVKVGMQNFVVHSGKSSEEGDINKSVPQNSSTLHVKSALKSSDTTRPHPPKPIQRSPLTNSNVHGGRALSTGSSNFGSPHRTSLTTPVGSNKTPSTSVASPAPSSSSHSVTFVGNTVPRTVETRPRTSSTLEPGKTTPTKDSSPLSSVETNGKIYTMPMVYETWSIYTSMHTQSSPAISSIFVNGVQHNRSLLSLPSSLDVVSVLNSASLTGKNTSATLERYSMNFFPRVTNPHLRTASSLDTPAQPETHTLRIQATRNLMRKGAGLLRASEQSDFKFLSGSPSFILGFNNPFLDHATDAKTLSLRPRISQGVNLGLALDVQGSTVVGYDTNHRCLMRWDLRNLPTVTSAADAHISVEATHTSPACPTQVTSMAIRPQDGGVLIGHGMDLSLWDLREPEIVSLERWAHTDPITAMACNPIRDYQVLTGDAGGTIRLWDIRQMKRNYDEEISSPLFISKLHRDTVTRLQWSKNNPDVFGSSGRDGLVALWNPRAKDSKGALFYHRGHRGPVQDFSFVDKDFLVISAGHYQHQGKPVNEVQLWRPNPWLMDLDDL
ncbi:hypothetical protein IWQ62_001859 [Dispira parvispora]|uniref:Uncharacterized protein n=1 Tax=Dispira parvispora TaxID=1520584 RepID=A0A9W8AX03_9FUNG|nr:hypothetical protein IWQ62_001859 [Dispira parvispora]